MSKPTIAPACHYAPVVHGTLCNGRVRPVRNNDGDVFVCQAHFVPSEDKPQP